MLTLYPKIIGSFFVIGSCFLFGVYLSQKLKNRKDYLSSFIDFLTNLNTNVRYLSDDIFSLIHKSSKEMLLFKDVNCCDLTIYWEDYLSSLPSNYGLKKDDYSIIKSFGDMLGKTDIEGQINHISLHKELFAVQLKNAESEYISKSKLYKVLGLFFGVSIVLMII